MDLEGTMQTETSQRKTSTVWSHLYVDSKSIELRNRVEWWLPGAEGWGKHGDAGQRVQTFSVNNFQGSNVYNDDYS